MRSAFVLLHRRTLLLTILFGSFILSACVPGLNGKLFSDADATGDPHAPASIQVEGPLRAVATYCNGPFTVTLKDSSGETAVVHSSLSLSLSVSSGGNGLFFSDSECATGTSSLEIAGGESKASFYFKGNIAQGLSLVAAAARLKTVAFEYTVTANDYTIEVASGDAQSGTVGAAVSSQLVAVVKDSMGRVVPDVAVDWAVVAGGGSLSVASSTTSMSGLSSNSYTLGTNLVAKSITATVQGTSTSATFSATAVPGAAAQITIVSGDAQVAAISTGLTLPMVVSVADSYGNPVTGSATINWAITAGGGSLGAATSTVDSTGLASNTLTVGATSGANTVTATLAGSPSLTRTFNQTATLCSGLALTNTPFANSGAGVGDSSGNPFIICTATQLNQISDSAAYMAKFFQLGASLNMTGVTANKIGSSTRPFTGYFDGGSYTISNLNLTGSANNVGLFGYASSAFTIKNLTLAGPTISAAGFDNVGALLGYATSAGATVRNIQVSGATVTGRDKVGGLIGGTDYWTGSTTLTLSTVTTSTVSGRTNVGGALGYFGSGTVSQNSVRSTLVTASGNYGGGVAGFLAGTFTKNSAIANVTVTGNYAGGLMGHWNGGTCTDSYATHDGTYGTITGANVVGGAIGYIENGGSPLRLYSTATVSTVGATKGGLVASYGGGSYTCTGCFWDTTTSGIGTSLLGYGLATSVLKEQTPYLVKDYDFAANWTLPTVTDYPKLQWEDSGYAVPALATLLQGGVGTLGSPYLITSTQDLKNWAMAMNIYSAARSAYYKLSVASPLDMTGVVFGGIGSTAYSFTGTFDGNNQAISNLSISMPYGAGMAGLIANASGAFTLKNLTLTSPTISASAVDYVGALLGYATSAGATVRNIQVSGATVTGRDKVGGLIGGTDYWTGSTTLTLSTVTTSTVSGRTNVGGALGYFGSGTVSQNSVRSTLVTASGNYGGGVAGFLAGTFTKNSAIANVTVTGNYAGGLMGHWNGGTCTDSYATHDGTYGTITGANVVGGAIGYIENGGSPLRLYSTATVSTVGATKGGLVASYGGGSYTCTGCFWDTTTSGIGTSLLGYGLATSVLKEQTPYLVKDYDFAANWTLPTVTDYPKLQWEDSGYAVPALATLLQGGVGTLGSPYLITSTQDLKNWAMAMNIYSAARSAYYKLSVASPLDMTGVVFGGIGSTAYSFTGTFDGNNQAISNLSISMPYGAGMAGLIANASGAFTLKNLTLTSPTISASAVDYVGALLGYASAASSTLQNLQVTGATVTGRDHVGSLIGYVNDWTGTFTLSSVTTSTSSGRSRVGGTAGTYTGGPNTVTQHSVRSTNVTATADTGGGFAGYLGGNFTKSSAIANVTVTGNYAGGLTGWYNGGTSFTDSYATHDGTYGTITGGNVVGGAIGNINNGSALLRIYATNPVSTVGATKGGLIASGSGSTCTNCFWDTTTTTLGSSALGTGQGTANMKTAATFSTWVASAVWTLIDGSYPALQ